VGGPIEVLRDKFSEALRWERRKRREQALASLLFYALLASLIALPFYSDVGLSGSRWLIPAAAIAGAAPFFLYRSRWRHADSVRALARLDKALGLDERALTAWEMLERGEARAPALLVVRQASEKLASVNPKTVFRRSVNWQAYLIAPLCLLWFALVWLEADLQFGPSMRQPAPTLAHKLKEFSRELQERANSEALPETLRLGRDLEEVARRGIEAGAPDEELAAELSPVLKKIDVAARKANAPNVSAAESRQDLRDLRAELEAARDLLEPPAGAEGMPGLHEQWLDRLATLPQLKRQFERGPSKGGMERGELKAFLDALQKQVNAELDRRTLLDAQQFLEQMSRQGRAERADANQRFAGPGEEDSPNDGARKQTDSNLPGDETGTNQSGSPSLPEFHIGAAAQLKGLLGPGQSGGIPLKGKPAAGTSASPEQDVIASYQRQAEAEINRERVPEALKETIKQYFLSLDEGKQTRRPGD
jgi:hypothetical protein